MLGYGWLFRLVYTDATDLRERSLGTRLWRACGSAVYSKESESSDPEEVAMV